MPIFQYGETEVEWLSKRDKRLAQAIERIGLIERSTMPDLFTALIQCIIDQQISAAAARTVNARILQVCGGHMSAEALLAAGADNLQRCGTSMRKVQYMLGVAEAVQAGKLDLSAIPAMDDAQVIQTLTGLKGIGIWTAEMLMIFSLGRPDVLSWGDLAIQRGIMRLYNHKELPRERFERYRRRYSPYGSTASLYLWALAK
ncbi:base excision DNA repair protein [Advenella kashmirensis WT001]|uniref:DNA-3-methyladenine glycosylase II n=1 Tax=Advenella kashmirensis (strain DSM 17095 / LMG 22695 / WT001) TaxID=1036672 RepID=I3UC26_ADVKW|nr:DNA-3-methyladenine glycosylase [Advenella kashmirensis]AFK62564.1 base excision DNA repair protein [Advenella kashmirensis WT001]